jgi:hypothetical protein
MRACAFRSSSNKANKWVIPYWHVYKFVLTGTYPSYPTYPTPRGVGTI